MNNLQSVVVGVISGIITAAVLHFMVLLFNRIVLPWYRQLVYRGVDISGKWEEHLDFGNGNTQIATAELTQRANAITGSVTVVKTSNGLITKTEILSIKGTIKDRLFNANLTPLDKTRVGIASSLLEVIGDGARMRGCSSWYDSGAAEIQTKCSEWARL